MTWHRTRQDFTDHRRMVYTCGQLRVEEIRSDLAGLLPLCLVLVDYGQGFEIVSRHRRKSAAFKRAEQLSRRMSRERRKASKGRKRQAVLFGG